MGSGHRFSYELFIAKIPDGLTIDHLCGVHPCVNPGHLEPVSGEENSRRFHSTRTHCRRGHPFDETNTRYVEGGRQCKMCARERRRLLEEEGRKLQSKAREFLEAFALGLPEPPCAAQGRKNVIRTLRNRGLIMPVGETFRATEKGLRALGPASVSRDAERCEVAWEQMLEDGDHNEEIFNRYEVPLVE